MNMNFFRSMIKEAAHQLNSDSPKHEQHSPHNYHPAHEQSSEPPTHHAQYTPSTMHTPTPRKDENMSHGHEYEEHEEYEHAPKRRRKPMEMELVHINPQEAETLDMAQGKRTYIPGTKTPHYKGLEIRISAPGGRDIFKRAVEEHAKGGQIGESRRQIEDMRRKGRFGDTMLVYMGKNTVDVLNHALKDITGDHRENKNPHTGHPEFYGLKNFFGSVRKGFDRMGSGIQHGFNKMGTTLGGVANSAVSHLRQAAPDMLQGALQGGLEGGPEGALMGGGMGALQGIGGSLMNPNNHDMLSKVAQNPLTHQLIGAGASAYDRYNQGQGMGQNIASTLNQATQGMNNPYARAINQGAQNYQQTGDLGRSAAAGAGHYASQMEGSPMQAFGHGLQGYAQHGQMPQAMMQGAQHLGNNLMQNHVQPMMGQNQRMRMPMIQQ